MYFVEGCISWILKKDYFFKYKIYNRTLVLNVVAIIEKSAYSAGRSVSWDRRPPVEMNDGQMPYDI